MSSILSNNAATVALQTLKSINTELATTQNEISTGRKVARPGDNSAVWAISKSMEADVRGYKGITESLTLGQSTVSVARQGAEAITELLTDIKGKVVSAQEENVDREKIQTDIEALVDQVGSIVSAASFNGLNLLENQSTEAGSGTAEVLSSLDRTDEGVVTREMSIDKRDLGINQGTIAASGGSYTEDSVTATLNATQEVTLDVSGETAEVGAAFSISVFGTDADDSTFTQDDYRTTAASSETQAEMAAGELSYVAKEGDDMADVVYQLGKKWEAYAQGEGLDSDTLNLSFSGTSITATSNVTDGTDSIALAFNVLEADAGSTVSGGLADLQNIDVTTDTGASKALGQIESMVGLAVDAAAGFGSDENRLEIQNDFISGLSDTIKAGIGTLVDTDMEESSARLQALQVQQQLATQALSIANSSPNQLLALFR